MANDTRTDVPVTSSKSTPRRAAAAREPFEGLERIFDQLVPRSWISPLLRWERPFPDSPSIEARIPRVDVIDRENEVVVKAEVAGMKKEDLRISLAGNLLTIRGETRSEEKEEKGEYYRCEIQQGAFSRTVTLPAEVDGAKAQAQMQDGMIEITLPKVEQARKQDIQIQ
jgi:HSP20 family protein